MAIIYESRHLDQIEYLLRSVCDSYTRLLLHILCENSWKSCRISIIEEYVLLDIGNKLIKNFVFL